MALARWQATIVDEAGNVLPMAQVTVRRELNGALIPLFEDRAGASSKGNPFQADANGYAFFHAPGGAYRIKAVLGSSEIEWRYVAVGMGAETDGFQIAEPAGDWDSGTAYSVGQYVYHESYIFISLVAANEDNEPDHETPGSTEEWMFAGAVVESATSIQSPDESVKNIIALTQSAYDAIETKDATTLYFVVDDD